MLVRFKSESSYVDYLESVATSLIKLAGASGNIPGAIDHEHLSSHLQQLRQGIERMAGEENLSGSGDDDISLKTRAKPLLDLMSNAEKDHEYVMWDYS